MLRIGTNVNTSKNTTPYIVSVKVLPNPANSYVSFIWDLKHIPSGVYVYTLKSEKYILNSGKIVINKQ